MGFYISEWWREWWGWDKVKNAIRSLPGRLGFEKGSELRFFRLRLNLENGEVYDEILERYLTERERYGLYFILNVYSKTKQEVKERGEYVTLSHICPAIHCPMFKENVKAFEALFGYQPELLYKAAKPFGYETMEYGDAAVKIYTLPKVPIVIGIWAGEESLPPSANILFDKSVTNYLDCEAAIALAGATLARLILSLAKTVGIDVSKVKFSYRYQCTE